MGALTGTRPTSVGVSSTPQAVSASDTIDAGTLGTLGAYLDIINGAGSGSNTVTISDGGVTPAGGAASSSGGGAVGFGTAKAFYISPRAVNLVTGQVTVTNSAPTSVTYKLYPLG